MSAKEFRDLAKRGERWTFEAMNLLVRQAGDTVKGCKEDAWWQFIPVENFLVPLLHTLIGIGNDIFGHFKDMINDRIECLDPKEISVRQKVIQCEEAIQINVAKREGWRRTESGKKLQSLKGIVWRSKKLLLEMGESTGVGALAAVDTESAADLVDEMDVYWTSTAGEQIDQMDEDEGEEATLVEAAQSAGQSVECAAAARVDLLKAKIKRRRMTRKD